MRLATSDPSLYEQTFTAEREKNLSALKRYQNGEIEKKDLPGALIIIPSDYQQIKGMNR